jgi:hypothetical protein
MQDMISYYETILCMLDIFFKLVKLKLVEGWEREGRWYPLGGVEVYGVKWV